MMISIASGKGGTGKTFVAVNLAASIPNRVQLLDCDVEEPNASLFWPVRFETRTVVTTPVPEIEPSLCNFCGKCEAICQFKAIAVLDQTAVMIFPELCHGCGGCMAVCGRGALHQGARELGEVESGSWNGIEFVLGRLRVGEAMSPPLIRKVKSLAKPPVTTIIDAPPGTSCPLIESIKGTDFVVLVTEPTPFGLHDLKLALSAVQQLGIPHGVVINRSGIGDGQVKAYAASMGIPLLMEIPFERRIAEATTQGKLIVDEFPEYRILFQKLLQRLQEAA